MQWTLQATKLHRPARPGKQVQRPQLFQRLNEGLDNGHLLTLISAPAGFGKTTCVMAWLDQLDLPVTWLSLDPSDDDPGRFFTYFTAALQQIDGNLGRAIQATLPTGQLPPVDSLTTAFINDIAGVKGRFLFVFDDFHVIQDRTILNVLERIIANQPSQVHFVLVTREDPLLPLARLRANNRMTEVRASDLRFSESEVACFFREVMDLPLSEEGIKALEDRTEGWAAGLQLAGLSMRGKKDPWSIIASLTGSHRYILSYLTEEVLSHQPEEIQNFLLQTSILDRLSGDLCDAVTGRTDSDSLLERLYNANLFLISLEDDSAIGAGAHWYRYHHLFADLLRTLLTRLPKNQVDQLHQRASRWYDNAGMISEAIEHALAAKDYQYAVALMEAHAMSIIMQGYVKTVERWFQAVPSEWHLQSPRANLAVAGMYLMRGNYSLVNQYLQQAEMSILSPGSADSKNSSLRPEWLALKANLCNVQGNAAESLEMAQQALLSAQPGDFYVRGIAYLGLGGAYRLLDDYPKLVDAYQKAIQNSRAANNSLSEMLSTAALALMAIQHGQLHFAEEVALQVIDRIDASGSLPLPVAGSIYGALGMVLYEWNQLARAHSQYARGLQLSQLGGHNAGIVFARVLLSRLNAAQGDLTAAGRDIQEAVDLLPLGVPAWLKPEVIHQQVRIDLARGNLTAAQSILTTLDIDLDGPITQSIELYVLAWLRWILAQARAKHLNDDLHRAIDTASRLVDAASQGERVSILIPALLLRAQMHAVLGRQAQAQEDLSRALARAEPEGYLRAFVDEGHDVAVLLKENIAQRQRAGYASRLLAAFSDTGWPECELPEVREPPVLEAPAALPEPLTERELDVLRLIAAGLKYEQIADRLVISLNTVRFYVKAVYGKLQVNNRTHAVEAARQMRLI